MYVNIIHIFFEFTVMLSSSHVHAVIQDCVKCWSPVTDQMLLRGSTCNVPNLRSLVNVCDFLFEHNKVSGGCFMYKL